MSCTSRSALDMPLTRSANEPRDTAKQETWLWLNCIVVVDLGDVKHSGNLKEFVEEHRDKKIMILGGGETASDVMDEW